MSKNIAITDDVYHQLKREKGDRSFSEVIDEYLTERRRLADVTGVGILDEATYDAVEDDIERMSDVTLSRVEDETV